MPKSYQNECLLMKLIRGTIDPPGHLTYNNTFRRLKWNKRPLILWKSKVPSRKVAPRNHGTRGLYDRKRRATGIGTMASPGTGEGWIILIWVHMWWRDCRVLNPRWNLVSRVKGGVHYIPHSKNSFPYKSNKAPGRSVRTHTNNQTPLRR